MYSQGGGGRVITSLPPTTLPYPLPSTLPSSASAYLQQQQKHRRRHIMRQSATAPPMPTAHFCVSVHSENGVLVMPLSSSRPSLASWRPSRTSGSSPSS